MMIMIIIMMMMMMMNGDDDTDDHIDNNEPFFNVSIKKLIHILQRTRVKKATKTETQMNLVPRVLSYPALRSERPWERG